MPVGFFSSSKGLCQVDPISPYLFVLGMEVLSALIRKAIDGGFIFGCRLRGKWGMEMNVSHLLFVDDTIIFYEARKEHLTHLGWILGWFEATFGLRINLAKSELIPVGEVEDIEEMVVELGCRVGDFLVKYLGLPLGAHHKALSMWDGVEERIRRRLAIWKRQYMSKGMRITLIKSTLASIPIYQLSLFRMPKLVVKRLDMEEDSVLWKGGGHGIFGVKDAYNLLVVPNVCAFPIKCIWEDKVSTKIAFFAWEATWGKILTLDRLQKRGWQLPNRCFLCGCEEENVNHILLHYIVVRTL